MSDITPPSDPAIDLLRDRVRKIEIDIATHRARLEGATMVRDELLEVIDALGRKTRAPRKPRAVLEVACGTVAADAPAPDAPAPFAFVPAFAREPEAEARDG